MIAPDGQVHQLDPKAVTEVPREAGSLSELRELRGKLPNVTVGCVIEEVEDSVTRRRRVDAGELVAVSLGDDVPVLSTRISLALPAPVQPKIATFAWPKDAKLQRATANQQQTWRYAIERIEPVTYEDLVPGDVAQRPHLVVSTASSWQAVARSYRALVERRIAEGGIALPNDLRRAASVESAQAIVTWLHARVKPSASSLRGSSFAPSSIADVVKRGTADAKDLAIVLVALLRQSGMRADVALLATGPGRDVVATTPGVDRFDHAIVRVQIGAREVWIDPLAALARVGQLPSESQGRLALVIADSTTALARTPKRLSAETVVRLTRTLEPSKQTDRGARVTEHNSHGGSFEDTIRNEWNPLTPARIKQRLAAFAEDTLGGTYESHRITAPSDLSTPFEITVVATDSGQATTDREAITVELRPRDAFVYARLTHSARVHALEWPVPHVYEVVQRIVLPPGYLPPALAPDRTRQLGGATFAETRRIDGKTIVVTYRLDTGKALWTAEQVRAYHTGLAAIDDELERIVIGHEAWSLAESGKSREALAAVDALIKAYPKDGVHHQQRAVVLLRAGLGAAARKAAQRAIAVEPKQADMHVFAGWVLRHDSFGREFGVGYDRAGAIAAFAQAQKLDPKHVGAFAEHAMVLERDLEGRPYEGDMRGAIAAWRKAYALGADHGYELAMALAVGEQYAESAKVAAKLARSSDNDALHVAMIAASASPATALAKLNTLATGADRSRLLADATRLLKWLRLYDAGRTLSPPPASGSPVDDVMKRIARKPLLKPGREPGKAALAANLSTFDNGLLDTFWDRQTREELWAEDLAPNMNARAQMARLTRSFLHDAMQVTSSKSEGRANGPWRVELEAQGSKSILFVALDRGIARVIGSPRASEGIGRHALRLVAANDLVGASQLLDWLRADPSASWVSQFWASGKQSRSAIELASAIVASGTAASSIAIFEKCDSTLPDMRDRCDTLLGIALEKTKRWPELDAHVKKWLPRATKSKTFALTLEISAASRLGRHDRAEQLAAAQVAARPDDAAAIRAHALVASERGRLADAASRMEPLLKKQPPHATDQNNVAWLQIALGNHAKALELARAATRGPTPHASNLSTLATAEAELGHVHDAKLHQLQAFERRHDATPNPAGIYVFGRIAEQLGLRDDAIALYQSVAREPGVAVSPHDFAQKRLQALGAKP